MAGVANPMNKLNFVLNRFTRMLIECKHDRKEKSNSKRKTKTRRMKIFFNFLILMLTSLSLSAQQTKKIKSENLYGTYNIQDSVFVKTRDGATLSLMVVRKNGDESPYPVILQSTIYVRDTGRDIAPLKKSVDNGYIGVIVYARGKRFSPDEVFPYENDANDPTLARASRS